MDLTKAMELFEEIKRRVQNYQKDLRNSEFRTRILLIDPVLRLLGWDVENPDLVVLEYQPAESNRKSADYVLKNNGKNVAIVEAKNIDIDIEDWKHRDQADDYARYAEVKFFVLTNGVAWMLYERDLMTSIESLKPIVRFDVVHDEPYQCALAAISMWRPNLASDGGPSEATEPVFTSDETSEQQLPDELPTEGEESDESEGEGKEPPTRLIVTMPDEEKIDHPSGIETFAEVIQKLGINQVRSVYPDLISTSKSPKYGYQIGQYYIKHQTNTGAKKRMLKKIAGELGEKLQVEIVSKN